MRLRWNQTFPRERLLAVPLVLAAVVFLVLSGRRDTRDEGAPSAYAADFAKLQIEPIGEGTRAPDFSLETPEGKRLGLGDFRGRIVFLNFWATWCPSCIQEMPTMEVLHRKFADRGLVVLAVSYRDSAEEARRFVARHGLSFAVLLDRDGEVLQKYGAWALPTTFLVDRDGFLLGKAAGYREWDGEEALALFERLLAPREKG
jgi:peroxiredoxin